MILFSRRRRCVVVALAASALLVGPAHAQWSSSATGPTTAQSTTLQAPSGLTAACGGLGGLLDTQVRLAWSASATASLGPVLYEVRWGTSPGSYTWTYMTAADELSYDTPALSGSLFGTTYYFVVRTAAGTVWRSANSNQRTRSITLLGCS